MGREGERAREKDREKEEGRNNASKKGTFPLFALKIKHHSRVENIQKEFNALELLKVSCLRPTPTCTVLLLIVLNIFLTNVAFYAHLFCKNKHPFPENPGFH